MVALLALSSAATAGVFSVVVALIAMAGIVVPVLLTRRTQAQVRENTDGLAELLRRTEGAERREEDAMRREDDCLDALAWVVDVVRAGHDLPTPMPPAIVRAMARRGETV